MSVKIKAKIQLNSVTYNKRRARYTMKGKLIISKGGTLWDSSLSSHSFKYTFINRTKGKAKAIIENINLSENRQLTVKMKFIYGGTSSTESVAFDLAGKIKARSAVKFSTTNSSKVKPKAESSCCCAVM